MPSPTNTFATTAELESSTASNPGAILAEAGKAGTFTIRNYADFSGKVSSDGGKINYIRSTSDPSKVWVRTSILAQAASRTGTSSGTDVQGELDARPTSTALATAGGAGLSGFSHTASYADTSIGRKLQEILSVKDAPFNAKGDGITDDTAAIRTAYDKACEHKAVLYFPSGNYICSGIDLGGAAHKGCTFQGESYDGRGNGYLSSRITLKAGSNRPLFTLLAGDAPQPVFRHLVLDGNQDFQSSNDYIFVLNDDSATSYPFGAHFEWVHFQYGRGGGLKLGKRRGWSVISNVGIYDCGAGSSGHGIFIDTYDVIMTNVQIGKCHGYGLYLSSGSQIQGVNVNSYANITGGIYLGSGVADCYFLGGSIDRNQRWGVYSAANSGIGTYDGARAFVATRFLSNGLATPNAFPDVLVDAGSQELIFSDCSFMGYEGGNKPSYAIQFVDGNGQVRLSSNRFAAKSRWGTNEWANNYGLLRGPDIPGFPIVGRSTGDGWSAPGTIGIGGSGGDRLQVSQNRISLPGLPLSSSYANDIAAAAGGVAVGELYRNGSTIQIRVA